MSSVVLAYLSLIIYMGIVLIISIMTDRLPGDVITLPYFYIRYVLQRNTTYKTIWHHPYPLIAKKLFEAYGMERYIKDAEIVSLWTNEVGAMYHFRFHPRQEWVSLVKVKNSTPEPDGTYKDYYIRVPPHIYSPNEGIAWSFGLDIGEYAPVIET